MIGREEQRFSFERTGASVQGVVEAMKEMTATVKEAGAILAKTQAVIDQAYGALGPNPFEDDDGSDEICPCGDPDCSRPFGHDVIKGDGQG